MKKLACIALVLMMILLSGCEEEKEPEPQPEPQQFSVTFTGGCEDKTITVTEGDSVGDVNALNLKYVEAPEGCTINGFQYSDQNTGKEFDFTMPVEKDTVVYVEVQLGSYAVADPDPDPVSDFIEVESLDVPDCKYYMNGYRYQLYMKPGQTYQLNPVLSPENATDKSVSYKTENLGVVSVSENGLVTALKYGGEFVWPLAHNGMNVGVLVRVYGYDMKVSLKASKTSYTIDDYVEFDFDVTQIGAGIRNQMTDLPENAELEIISGDKILIYDHYDKVMYLTENPKKESKIKFRFIVKDGVGKDVSNTIEITVAPAR